MDNSKLNSNRRKRIKSIPGDRKYRYPIRVAAYCRVSTNEPEQLHSLALQKWHYEAYIKEQRCWEFAGIYEDIGSGTQIKGRYGFQQMMEDCDAGKIDLIITKSIFRFSRNTLESLKAIRHLKEIGVGILFDQEKINTLTEKSEFAITVLTAYSQNESESKSRDIRFGLERSFENPDSKYYQRICYGYRHDENGKLVFDDEKAEVVRLIYRLAEKGHSLAQIAAELRTRCIPSPRSNATWSRETIRKMLTNEKYTGTVMLQKTFVEDCLTHRQVQNIGQKPKYVVEDNHEAIIVIQI